MSRLILLTCILLTMTRIEASKASVYPKVKREHSISVRSTPSLDPTEEILVKYGKQKKMNLTDLETLFNAIGLAVLDGNDKEGKSVKAQTCFTSKHFHGMYSRNDGTINKTDFIELCPAVVYQMTKQECRVEKRKIVDDHEDGGKEEPSRAWGFGFLFVTVISFCSLIGALVVPLMNQPIYKKLLMCMVSLAVGVLTGSGIYHLIPHAFGLPVDEHDHSFLWKATMMVLGLYIFLLLECVMKLYIRFKNMDKNKGDVSDEKKLAVGDSDMRAIGLGHGHSHNGEDPFPVVAVKDHLYKQQNSRVLLTKEMSCDDSEKPAIATVAWMIIIGDGLHNFIDGLAIGASFSSSVVMGMSTSVAVLCEELPHELGDFAILLNSGLTYKQAMLANFLSACICYIGLAIGLVLGYSTTSVKYIYGIAGGMFLYIALVDMLPEAFEMAYMLSGNSKSLSIKMLFLVNIAIIFGFGIMLLIAFYGESIYLG